MLKIVKISLYLYATLLLFVFTHHIFPQDKVKKIDELVQKYNAIGQFNGAVLVAENGKVIYSKGIGYADFENKIVNTPDTKFRLASITKQFTATLIMQLVEQGKIKLDGKLFDYLPYYRKDVGEKITISQLMSHTSGMDNYTNNAKLMDIEAATNVNPKEFVLKYCSNELVTEPGTKWAYSNSGYFILGLIIEEVTGKDYGSVLNENILVPIGMTNSGYEKTGVYYENKAIGYSNLFGEIKPAKPIDMSVPFSAGSMYSTVEDMFKWDQALYTEKILKKESLDTMFTPVMNNYGYGWQIVESPLDDNITLKFVTHSGGIFGFNTLETRFVKDNKFVVTLSNQESGYLNQLITGIVNVLYGLEPTPPKKSLATKLSILIKEKGIEKAMAEANLLKEKKDEYSASEGEINQLGYVLLQSGKVKESIKVFKLNVDLYPESWNVYDSYGEALVLAGDKENAIINYKKSLELNPDSEGGKQMLKKLEGK